MNKLHKFLDTASQAYYAGVPILSNQIFDTLADSCNYNKIGTYIHSKKAKHLYNMYSLQKVYEDEQKLNIFPHLDTINSIKLDGAAISLLYMNGILVQALTRGDGIEGQIITEKLYEHNKLVPLKIDLKQTLQITGEIVAPLHVENSRNYAAGSLNLKNLDEFRTRAIEFFAYQITPSISKYWCEDMALLKKHNFNTVLDPNIDKIYPSDGIVVRLKNNYEFERMGYTSKHPRGAYALKKRAQHVETKLLGVEWQVGKTGKVTPIAILEPVKVGDAIISRATLNNCGFIEALDLQIGDTVAVARAGEIIPCILYKVDI
jgi:DNA ligase (NAD+)